VRMGPEWTGSFFSTGVDRKPSFPLPFFDLPPPCGVRKKKASSIFLFFRAATRRFVKFSLHLRRFPVMVTGLRPRRSDGEAAFFSFLSPFPSPRIEGVA